MKWRNIHIQTPFPPRPPTHNHFHKKYTPAKSQKRENLSQNNSQDRFDTSFENSRLSKNSINSEQKQVRSSLEHITNKSNKLQFPKNKEQSKTKHIQKKMKKYSQQRKYIVTEDWIIRLKIQINKLLKCSENLTGLVKNYVQAMSRDLRDSHQILKQEMIKKMVDITYQINMMNFPSFSQQNSPKKNRKIENNPNINHEEDSTIKIQIDEDLLSPIKNFINEKSIKQTQEKINSNHQNTNTNTDIKINNINFSKHYLDGYPKASPGTQSTLKQIVKPFISNQFHDEQFGSQLMKIQQSHHPQSAKKKHSKNNSLLNTTNQVKEKDGELKPPLLSPIILSQKSSQLRLQSNQKLEQSRYGGKDLILEYSNFDKQDKKIKTEVIKDEKISQKQRRTEHLSKNNQMEDTLRNVNQCIDNMKKLLAYPL